MSDTIIKMTGGVIRQQKNTILKDVNVDIKSGEFIYLIGKVGSGKSSFLKTLYAELPLEYGTAEVAGFELKRIKKSQIPLLRRKCGIVFQDFKLLIDRNVYANLEFVLRATGWKNKKAIHERIETVLDKVGMSEKQYQMPHQLSGGEQQRIVLARALLNAPPIILADEPTGNIDPETSYRLVELLREICDTGKTIVIATHQYDLIEKYPGRVLCCSDGQLYEKCDPALSQAIAAEAANEQADLPEMPKAEACPLTSQPETMNEKITVEATTVAIPEAGIEETVIESTVESADGSISIEETTIITNEIVAEEVNTGETVHTATTPDENPTPEPEETGRRDEIPALIEISPDEITSPEETTESLLGKLSFPEVTAFDYELSEVSAPAASAYQIPTEAEDLSAPAGTIQAETATEPENEVSKNIAPEEESPENEEIAMPDTPEKQPKTKKPEDSTPTTPTFDLELID